MDKMRFNLTLTKEVYDEIERLAENVGIKRGAYIAMVLKQHIDSQAMIAVTKKNDMDKESMVEMLESMKKLVESTPIKE